MDQALIPISTIQKFPALARSQCLLENTPVSILIVVQLQNLIHNSEKDDKADIFSGYMLKEKLSESEIKFVRKTVLQISE